MKKSTNNAGFRLLGLEGAAHRIRSASLRPGAFVVALLRRFLDLLHHRHAVLQKLRPGNDDMVAGLQSVQHGVVVADRIAQL